MSLLFVIHTLPGVTFQHLPVFTALQPKKEMQGVYIKENSPKNKPTVVCSSITNLLYGVYIIQCCISLHVHEDEGLLSQVKTQVVHLWVIWKECVIPSNTNELLPRLCTYMQAGKALGSPSHMKHFILKTTLLKNFSFWKLCLHCYITNCLNTIKVFHDFISSQSKVREKIPCPLFKPLAGRYKSKDRHPGIQPCWK